MAVETVHFGQWLKREIENLGVDQSEFCRNAGISYWTLRVWLGQARPNIRGHNVVRLARALGIEREDVERELLTATRGRRREENPAARPAGFSEHRRRKAG